MLSAEYRATYSVANSCRRRRRVSRAPLFWWPGSSSQLSRSRSIADSICFTSLPVLALLSLRSSAHIHLAEDSPRAESVESRSASACCCSGMPWSLRRRNRSALIERLWADDWRSCPRGIHAIVLQRCRVGDPILVETGEELRCSDVELVTGGAPDLSNSARVQVRVSLANFVTCCMW